ncbi:MAG TPA: BzdV protein, partial [Rhodocyclaceae bacterium]|nr:BzdV protein [Rhodocyclaceae bacterium]
RAAAAMDRQLGGDGDIEEKLLPDGWHTSPFLGCDTGFNHLHRLHPLKVTPAERRNWNEVEHAFTEADARAEGSRCLKCNLAPAIAEPIEPPAPA